MARKTASLEEIAGFDPRQNRVLARKLDEMLMAGSDIDFFTLISPMLRGGKGKEYKNYSENLPAGSYKELEICGPQDSRRIVYDIQTYDIFTTPDHYQTMYYAGRPIFAQE